MRQLTSSFVKGLLICFALLLLQKGAWAHSVSYTIIKDAKPAVMEFQYSDGSPVSYAEVKIWAPNDLSIEYQLGRSDKNGRFTFVPSVAGIWKFKLSDGMGHALSDDLELTEQATLITQHEGASGIHGSKFVLAILGISLLLNIGFLGDRLFNKDRRK